MHVIIGYGLWNMPEIRGFSDLYGFLDYILSYVIFCFFICHRNCHKREILLFFIRQGGFSYFGYVYWFFMQPVLKWFQVLSFMGGRWRLALSGGTVTLCSYRNPKGNLGKEGWAIWIFWALSQCWALAWPASESDILLVKIVTRHRNSRPGLVN